MTPNSLCAAVSRTLVLAAVTVSSVALLAGCSLIPSPEGDPGGDTSGTGPGRADVFMLVVGDCFNESDTDSGSVSDVSQLDCGQPHDYEIYDSFDLAGDVYPGDDEVRELAAEGCTSAFDLFVGIDYAHSAYELNHLTPTEDSWNSGDDREVLCLIYDPDAKVTGSLENAAS